MFRRFFADALASSGALVAIDPARAEPGEVEIGWTFLSSIYGSGPTSAAIKSLMVGHALIQFDRVIFIVGEGNVRSRRAMEKIAGQLTKPNTAPIWSAGGFVMLSTRLTVPVSPAVLLLVSAPVAEPQQTMPPPVNTATRPRTHPRSQVG